MFGVLVACKLEESYMAAQFRESVICLSVPELELEIGDFWEAPRRTAFGRELGGNPEFENLGLALELVAVFTVIDRCETGDIDLETVVILADALGEKVADLRNLKNLVGFLEFHLLLVSQATPRVYIRLGAGGVPREYLLSLLDIDGHAKKTTRGDIVRRLSAITELRGLFSGKYLLQFSQGNIYSWG